MNVIQATTLRNNLSDSIKEVEEKKDFLLIAKRKKVSSALVSLDLLEDLLELTDSSYLRSIKEAREQYEKGETYSHDEIFGDI